MNTKHLIYILISLLVIYLLLNKNIISEKFNDNGNKCQTIKLKDIMLNTNIDLTTKEGRISAFINPDITRPYIRLMNKVQANDLNTRLFDKLFSYNDFDIEPPIIKDILTGVSEIVIENGEEVTKVLLPRPNINDVPYVDLPPGHGMGNDQIEEINEIDNRIQKEDSELFKKTEKEYINNNRSLLINKTYDSNNEEINACKIQIKPTNNYSRIEATISNIINAYGASQKLGWVGNNALEPYMVGNMNRNRLIKLLSVKREDFINYNIRTEFKKIIYTNSDKALDILYESLFDMTNTIYDSDEKYSKTNEVGNIINKYNNEEIIAFDSPIKNDRVITKNDVFINFVDSSNPPKKLTLDNSSFVLPVKYNNKIILKENNDKFYGGTEYTLASLTSIDGEDVYVDNIKGQFLKDSLREGGNEIIKIPMNESEVIQQLLNIIAEVEAKKINDIIESNKVAQNTIGNVINTIVVKLVNEGLIIVDNDENSIININDKILNKITEIIDLYGIYTSPHNPVYTKQMVSQMNRKNFTSIVENYRQNIEYSMLINFVINRNKEGLPILNENNKKTVFLTSFEIRRLQRMLSLNLDRRVSVTHNLNDIGIIKNEIIKSETKHMIKSLADIANVNLNDIDNVETIVFKENIKALLKEENVNNHMIDSLFNQQNNKKVPINFSLNDVEKNKFKAKITDVQEEINKVLTYDDIITNIINELNQNVQREINLQTINDTDIKKINIAVKDMINFNNITKKIVIDRFTIKGNILSNEIVNKLFNLFSQERSKIENTRVQEKEYIENMLASKPIGYILGSGNLNMQDQKQLLDGINTIIQNRHGNYANIDLNSEFSEIKNYIYKGKDKETFVQVKENFDNYYNIMGYIGDKSMYYSNFK